MSIFAVIAPTDNSKLGPVIETQFANKQIQVWAGQWLISTEGTTQQISETLGINGGINGSGIVLSIVSYWGRANPGIWEWLKSQQESK